MAVETYEELVARLSADERKVFDNAIAKVPQLKEGWLRQDDYSRKQAELVNERKKFETDLEYGQRMKAWSQDTWPKLEAAGIIDDEGNETWTTQKAEFEKQLEAAKNAAVGGDMDPAELDKRVRDIVKAAGGLTAEEMKAVINSEGKKLAEETFSEQWKTKESDFNTKTIPFVWGGGTQVSILANHYEKESGELWTSEKTEELFKLMNQEQVFDALKLEEKFMAPIRSKRADEQRIKDAIEADRKTRGGMPGGGNEDFIPNPEEKGALQKALEQSGSGADFETMIKTHSVEAAKALRAEGKA